MRACEPHAHYGAINGAPTDRAHQLASARIPRVPLRSSPCAITRRKIRRIRPECRQRPGAVARRGAPQVEHRQKCVGSSSCGADSAHSGRIAEGETSLAIGRRAIPSARHPGDLDRRRSQSGSSDAEAMAVPHPRRSRPSGSFKPFIAARQRRRFILDQPAQPARGSPDRARYSSKRWELLVDRRLRKLRRSATMLLAFSSMAPALSSGDSGRLDTASTPPPISIPPGFPIALDENGYRVRASRSCPNPDIIDKVTISSSRI